MDVSLLFENERFLVVNKPSKLVVHSDGKTDEPTLVDWILEHYPDIEGVGENMLVGGRGGVEVELNRPGIVHRIDRDTSGCLVIAKTQEAFLYLKEQFQQREVQKSYRALAYGIPKQRAGSIDAPIGRSAKDFRMKQAGTHARGTLRDAHTDYRVCAVYEDRRKKNKQGQFERYSLFECFPKTGRTHQIRVHLKFINHPIVADSLYRGKRKECLGLARTALHAASVSFVDVDGECIDVHCPLPTDMSQAIDLLSRISLDEN